MREEAFGIVQPLDSAGRTVRLRYESPLPDLTGIRIHNYELNPWHWPCGIRVFLASSLIPAALVHRPAFCEGFLERSDILFFDVVNIGKMVFLSFVPAQQLPNSRLVVSSQFDS